MQARKEQVTGTTRVSFGFHVRLTYCRYPVIKVNIQAFKTRRETLSPRKSCCWAQKIEASECFRGTMVVLEVVLVVVLMMKIVVVVLDLSASGPT